MMRRRAFCRNVIVWVDQSGGSDLSLRLGLFIAIENMTRYPMDFRLVHVYKFGRLAPFSDQFPFICSGQCH